MSWQIYVQRVFRSNENLTENGDARNLEMYRINKENKDTQFHCKMSVQYLVLNLIPISLCYNPGFFFLVCCLALKSTRALR